MKAVLAQSQDGARVVIEGEDITILQEQSEDLSQRDGAIEGDRLKALGDFEVQVKVKGGDPVVRTVSIRAQGVVSEADSQRQDYSSDVEASNNDAM